MKIKTLVAACALAFAGQASALPTTATADVTLFISGSSAVQTMIGQVAKSMMVPASLDAYFDLDAVNGNGKNYRAYFGQASAAAMAAYPSLVSATPGVGKNILILETAKGGSIQGVNPVALSTPVNSLAFTGCVAAGTDAASGAPLSACSGVNTTRIPDAGISDVEPATLEAPVNLGTATALPSSQLAALTQTPMLGVVMGIAVTNNLTNVSNLSKAQVASLMNGAITDFNKIEPTATAGTTVVVCRRVAGSGTQAAINASMFGNPCMSGALTPVDHFASTLQTGVVPATGNYIVVENNSSGNVKGCLTAAQNGNVAGQAINLSTGTIATYTGAVPAGSVVLTAGSYGIGLLGVDSGVPATAKFVSINGTAPTVANAASGLYDTVVEATFNDRGLGFAVTAQADAYKLFQKNAGDPAILGTAGTAGAPIPGVAALSENLWVSPTFNAAAPVLRVGNFGNTCAPLQVLQ